jgi:predicted RNA-binding protein with PIN domain
VGGGRGGQAALMRWLIDGYNVIRRDPELHAHEADSLEAGRAALLTLLARVASRLSDDFTVVFDGARRTGGGPSGGRVQVVFSRPPETADDVLRRLAGTLREGAVVVTSDRAVQDSARRAGAVAVAAEAFLQAAAAPAADADDTEEDDGPRSRRGPSHRPSREAREAERVLRRLREH